MQFFKKRRGAAAHPLISTASVNRILLRSVLLFSVLVLGFLTIFYFALQALTQRSYIESNYRSMISLLEQTDTTLQNALDELTARCDTVLQSSSVTSLMITDPSSDFTRLCEGSAQLSSLQKNNLLVQNAWLYFCSSDMVLTGGESLLPLAESSTPLPDLIEGGSGLLVRDRDYYFIVDYPTSDPLAKLILQLDGGTLYRSVRNGYSHIYIYDSAMQPLFSCFCRYPDEESLQIGSVLRESAGRALYRAANGDYLALYRSAAGSTNYLMRSTPSVYPSGEYSHLRLWLPGALAVLLAAIAYSVFTFSTIYRPIQKMLDSIVLHPRPQADKAPLQQNVFQALGKSWTDTELQNQALTQTLAGVAPSVALQLFHRIIFDGFGDSAAIGSMLPSIQNVFPTDKPFLVLYLQPHYADQNVENDVYSGVYLLHLRTLALDFWKGKFPVLTDETGSGDVLVILSCGESTPTALSLAVGEFCDSLLRRTKDLPYTPVIGLGALTEGIENLHTAYLSACQSLHHQIYYRGADPQPEAPRSRLVELYSRRTQELLAQAQRQGGHPEEALRALLSFQNETEELSEVLQAMHALVIEKMLAVSMDFAQLTFVRQPFVENLSLLKDTPENRAYLEIFLTRAAEAFVQRSHVNRNRYLATAKEYIAQNYADSALSLDTVSRHVGISGPYLSSTFSELQGQRFVDYLNSVRIEKACLLLQATELNITEVGFRTGFYSANSFIRVFKKLTGKTPGAYRAQYRSAAQDESK